MDLTPLSLPLLRRGDIYLVDFGPGLAGEVDKIHPAILVTNNLANQNAHVVVVVPLTSNLERVYPFELVMETHRTGLNKDSKAQVNLLRHVSTSRLLRPLSFVPDDLMQELDERLLEHLALKR